MDTAFREYWQYPRCTIVKHTDADTTRVKIDMGLDTDRRVTVRWLGINAPERFTELGKISTAALEIRLPVGTQCMMMTVKDDTEGDRKEKFGRYLAVFAMENMFGEYESINQWLIDEGLAQQYDVGKKYSRLERFFRLF